MKVSIGIPAYNEAQNIGKLIDALLSQKLEEVEIDEIIVIASGCTDDTVKIVTERCIKSDKLYIFTEPERKGKAPAVNMFLELAINNVCILMSADVIPAPDCVEALCKPFRSPMVGMTGVHVFPTNNPDTFTGFLSWYRWAMSHEVSLVRPVLGEMVAFRNIINPIPLTAADETCIEAEITKKGFQITYVPTAIVYNRGPETLKEYVSRRRRISVGQLQNMAMTGYSASSQNIPGVIKAASKNLTDWRIIPAVVIEAYCRAMAYKDYRTKNNLHIWDAAQSTKKV